MGLADQAARERAELQAIVVELGAGADDEAVDEIGQRPAGAEHDVGLDQIEARAGAQHDDVARADHHRLVVVGRG